MDSWGQGQWFEFQEQGESDSEAAAADESHEGSPADFGADADADADADAADSADDLDDWEDAGANPAGSGGSGSFPMPMPPIPSRPLGTGGPGRSYSTGAPVSPPPPPPPPPPHDSSPGWYNPATGAFSQPLPRGSFGDPPPPPQFSARAAYNASRRRDGERRWRPAWMVLLASALLLIVCAMTGILTGFLPQMFGISGISGAASTNTPQNTAALDTPTADATIDPNSTATVTVTAQPTATGSGGGGGGGPTVLPPTAATVSFSVATSQRSSAGSMTSCPGGCDIVGNAYSGSKDLSESNPASLIPQSSLTGTIHVINSGSTNWSASNYSFSRGYACAPQSVFVAAHSSRDFTCFIGLSSPSSIPAHTIEGTAATDVTFTQPSPLTGNQHYEVLASDCQAALNDIHNSGKSWAASWMSGQSAPSGWRFALGDPAITFSGDSCPTGQQQKTAFNFTAATTTTARNAAYNPAAAQALASNRLDGMLPGGYQWKSGSRTTCNPTVKSVDGSNKVTLNCSDSATAYYVWTSSLKSQLAGKLAGQSKSQALGICNKTAGVRANSCSIAITGGTGAVLPASASALTIVAKGP